MVNARTVSNWKLETRIDRRGECFAWVSNPIGRIIGYACSGEAKLSLADIVRRAMVDACHHYETDCDEIADLEREYFGPCGSLATMANANSGQ